MLLSEHGRDPAPRARGRTCRTPRDNAKGLSMSESDGVVAQLPFHGRWLARNSPARRVPSHGTHLFGTTYAIDFIAVDERGRSAARTWRTLLSVEHPELFVGFGRPVLAPVAGRVAAAHDAEPDQAARRS